VFEHVEDTLLPLVENWDPVNEGALDLGGQFSNLEGPAPDPDIPSDAQVFAPYLFHNDGRVSRNPNLVHALEQLRRQLLPLLLLAGASPAAARRVLSRVIAQASQAAADIEPEGIDWEPEDFESHPSEEGDPGPRLGDDAVWQLKSWWLETWEDNLIPALLALVPTASAEDTVHFLAASLTLSLDQEEARVATVRQVAASDSPPEPQPDVRIRMLTAPHGPDDLADAKPVQLVRAFGVAA